MTFIKLLGGNSNILPSLVEYFPDFKKVNGYVDPFLGGGNVFQKIMTNYHDELRGKPIYLSDINKGLINSFRIVRDNVDELIPFLEYHQKLHSDEYYYDIRDEYNRLNHIRENDQLKHDIEDAARFIYLVNNAFGGMWRVNQEGKMNSSFSGNTEFNFNYVELKHFSALLVDTYINDMSFEKILDRGDLNGYFVYLSPPYDIINGILKHDNFKLYSKDGFSCSKRSLLLTVFRKLDKMGCKVMMSNSFKNSLKKEFAGYNIFDIKTDRYDGVSLNNRTADKLINARKLKELIITNYDVTKKQKTIYDRIGGW